MKQLIQSKQARTIEVPVPVCGPGQLLVQNSYSLVSRGTEQMAVQFAQKNLFGKARSRPDLVARVIGKVKRDGLMNAFDSVKGRLGKSLALGYSSAGRVLEVGSGVEGFRVGDRVACAGSGYAVHAEVVCVPSNLVVPVPEDVSLESAAFVTIGTIAVQGVRTANVRFGESVVVVGLGLIGLTLVQVLTSAGCHVAGMDTNPSRCAAALDCGCSIASADAGNFEQQVMNWTRGRGCDAAIIAASTSSNGPVELAARLCRHGGTVVVLGAVGMELPRQSFYEKELTFRVSRSYGPGRYDPEYEEKGRDYPFAYVRWTEKRNMESFVSLLDQGKVKVEPLISHRFPIEDADQAYRLIGGDSAPSSLGVLLSYPDKLNSGCRLNLRKSSRIHKSSETVSVGLLGAGQFASGVLIPELQKITGVKLMGICAATGLRAREAGERFGFDYCTTSEEQILNDEDIDLVVIATRHHLHSRQLMAALKAGKHAFCEKPLCLSLEELSSIVALQQASAEREPAPMIMVGYNRRFSGMIAEIKDHLQSSSSWMLQLRVNAGPIPSDHWIHDPHQGGGRVAGEVCHFADLCSFLIGEPVSSVLACAASPDQFERAEENLSVRFTYPRGSIATLTYVAGGDPAVGKEYLEIFGGGLSIRMDDYKKLTVSKRGRRKTRRAILRQDKGHRQELSLFIERLRQGGSAPISFEEIVNSTLTTFAVQEALSSGEEIRLSAIKSRLAERVSSSSETSSADIDRRLPGDAP